MLWHVHELALLILGLMSLLAATEIGFRGGLRRRPAERESEIDHAGTLQASMIGILALLMGFTFYMAVSRYDTRKSLVVEEANAIGTVHLRAGFLAAPQRDSVRTLLREYVAARLAFHDAGIDPGRIDAANATATRLQAQLWSATVDAAAADPHSIPAGLFAQSVNELIDLQERRQSAFQNHVPEAVLDLLLATALFSIGFVGYACGLAGQRRFVPNAILATVIVLILTTIIDVDRPRRGLIEVSQDSLVRLQAQLAETPMP